eukprot:Gb_19610 [translate_table: standard]
MWVAVVFGVVIYKFMRRFFTWQDESGPGWEARLKIMVGNRLQNVYGGEVYSALRIPDIGCGVRQNIDMVLLTKRELSIVAVKNYSGILDVGTDGGWIRINANGQSERIPNPVEETRYQAAVLESYLERRGVILPPGYLNCKVILINPNCRPLLSVTLQPEVLSHDKWMQLNEESRGRFLTWVKRIFSGTEHEAQNKIDKMLRFILSTAPTWDRLDLKGNHQMLGEFLGFKGKKDDMDALKIVKRSKVSKVVNSKPTMFDFLGDSSNVHLFCVSRDYRHESSSESDRIEVNVKSSTEVVFQPVDAKRAQQFKIQKMVSLSLSP